MATANRMSASNLPPAAVALGYAGAIPFVALGLAALLGSAEVGRLALHALWGYGVAILSFLGGVHWGAAITQGSPTLVRLGGGVVPSLAGWASYLLGGRLGLWLLAVAFAALLAYDLHTVRAGGLPRWYPALRWPLTLIVVTALLLAGMNA